MRTRESETSAFCLDETLDARVRGHDGGWASRRFFQNVIAAHDG